MIYTVTLNPAIDHTMCFPRLALGRLNRAADSRIDLGGKGVNVSRALRQFGVQTVVMGFAAGMCGRILLEGLRQLDCDCRRRGKATDFVRVAGETRVNLTVIDEASGTTTKLNEPGPTVTDDDLRAFEERLLARLRAGDVCIFSGSLPPGAPLDTYANLISSVRGRGAAAALDTSGEALSLGCAAGPDWVKPNAMEAAQLMGMPFDAPDEIVSGCKAILALGPQRALVSLGRRGAALTEEGAVWLAKPPAVTERSAVGAGDALLAGALWAWGKRMPPEEIVRWAVASGTAAAMEKGTGMSTLARIQGVYGQVDAICLGGCAA